MLPLLLLLLLLLLGKFISEFFNEYLGLSLFPCRDPSYQDKGKGLWGCTWLSLEFSFSPYSSVICDCCLIVHMHEELRSLERGRQVMRNQGKCFTAFRRVFIENLLKEMQIFLLYRVMTFSKNSHRYTWIQNILAHEVFSFYLLNVGWDDSWLLKVTSICFFFFIFRMEKHTTGLTDMGYSIILLLV